MSKITHDDISLWRKIRRVRDHAHMSQEKLAEKTHLTQTHISLVETGKRKISMEALKKIASALGVKVKDLIPY